MNLRSLCVALAVTFFAAASTAQDGCPRTKAQHVPERFSFKGQQACPGITINVGGANVSTPGQNCPLLATHYPDHELEVPSGSETMVAVHAQAPTYIYHFACERDWFLVIPWGSTCQLSARFAGVPVLRMTTIPCAQTTP